MKKVSLFCLFLMLGVMFNSNAQTAAPADFYAGKWMITIVGTPNGDSKIPIELVRKDGKLTAELSNPAEPNAEKTPVAVEENGDLLELAFNAQGYDVTINLKKESEDVLKGQLMGMFDATANRVK